MTTDRDVLRRRLQVPRRRAGGRRRLLHLRLGVRPPPAEEREEIEEPDHEEAELIGNGAAGRDRPEGDEGERVRLTINRFLTTENFKIAITK